jgi:predicted HD phosphohydrolase
MTNSGDPDVSAERSTWLQHLLDAATVAAARLRARDDPTSAALLADLDALCRRLDRELDELE